MVKSKPIKSTNDGIIEISKSGEEISETFIIEENSTNFFHFHHLQLLL